MSSTKKHKKKKCLKCGTLLLIKNWATYDQKKRYYVCKTCRKIIDKKSHQADSNYAKKQKNRYRSRRSAVILAYGNACAICGEDDYTKLTINGDINYLYNNIIQKPEHQVTCYNCNKTPYKSKYATEYKSQLVQQYKCQKCCEERIERLIIINYYKILLCYNCYMSQLATDKFIREYPELQK